MNEVEKMYSNVGIEKEFEKPAECTKNPYITCDGCMLYDDKRGRCNNKKDYPPFTAEKQLEIVKTILFSTWWINLKRLQFSEKFDEGLAQMINDLWQDLTEEERKQIKEILSE